MRIRGAGEGNGPVRRFPNRQSLSYELDSEGFKLVADRLVEEAGIHAMLHRQCVAPVMDGDAGRRRDRGIEGRTRGDPGASA